MLPDRTEIGPKVRTRRAGARIDVFSATAARMSAFNAFSSILSPSWKSMARLVLPSRLELKRPEGSSNEAPLAKVSFTTVLVGLTGADDSGVRPHRNPSPLPLLDHFGVGLLDETSDPSERLAPPITQLLDSRIDQLRGRVSSFSFLRAALHLLHGVVAFFIVAVTRRGSHSFAGQLAGLLHPGGELSFVELVVLVDVEVAHVLLLGLAGRDRTAATRRGRRPP